MNIEVSDLEKTLGYEFKDKGLLAEALTHPSFYYENHERRSGSVDDNQRLEFLGDSVLGLAVASVLFRRAPELREGGLTRARAALVCEETLADIASSLNLSEYICLGKGEERDHGKNKNSILADAMEAVIASVYLDSDYKHAEDLVLRLIEKLIPSAVSGKLRSDYKSALLETSQADGENGCVSFEIISEEGPVHDRKFKARVSYRGLSASAWGKSKKEAEQAAAKLLFAML